MTDEELIDEIEKSYYLEACKTSSMFDCSLDEVFDNPASYLVNENELPF